ncbi:MAG: LON peptidase substrate-binding domain-containing protein [Proteobacteria bacterium]|nr:LON peptidase substrate-binding domain-containing protein [Pseudomonadota bacterium]
MNAPLPGIALFALNTVLFPGGRLALRLFEQRYLRMAKDCLRDKLPFCVCRIIEGNEVGTPATHESIGCLARISEWDMPQHGVLSVVALGEQRVRVLTRTLETDGLARGSVETLAEPPDATPPSALRDCVKLLERLLALQGEPAAGPAQRDSALWVSARLAERLGLPGDFSQQLLACDDALERLAMLHRALDAAGAFPAH